MIKSMTGFGISKEDNEHFQISVEVKSLNSKSKDFQVRLPKKYLEKEIEIKNLIGQKLSRGKVSINVDFEVKKSTQDNYHIDQALFKSYFNQLKELSLQLDIDKISFNDILKLPDVVTSKDESDNDYWSDIQKNISIALDQCDTFRSDEGAQLETKLKEYIANIDSFLHKIITLGPERIEALKSKIKKKIEEHIDEDVIDDNRFEQELIYYIEKLDIEEEKTRLNSHLKYFLDTMSKEECGKKLGFICQEIGREINTIGSKANNADIQKLVVMMKDELEKIKEQSFNVL